MSKYKFLDATFDNVSGISTATIQTELGIFEGKAQLHDEDRDIVSAYEGCKYAEGRAIIKYHKAVLKQKKAIYNNLKNIIINLERMNGYNKDSKEARFIRKQFYMAQKDYNDYKENIAEIEEYLYDRMKSYRGLRENYLKALEKSRTKSAQEKKEEKSE